MTGVDHQTEPQKKKKGNKKNEEKEKKKNIKEGQWCCCAGSRAAMAAGHATGARSRPPGSQGSGEVAASWASVHFGAKSSKLRQDNMWKDQPMLGGFYKSVYALRRAC